MLTRCFLSSRGKALLTRTSSNGKTQGSECKKAAKGTLSFFVNRKYIYSTTVHMVQRSTGVMNSELVRSFTGRNW